jgi:hypothetical protein
MSSRWLMLLALLLSQPSASWAASSPRAHVAGVAQAIEDEYFDADRGEAIAGQLRDAAAAGSFDALVDPRELASALTARLRPIDRHFSVSWTPPAAASAAAAGLPARPMQDEHQDRRSNYGIRGLEILPGNVGSLDMRYFADFEFSDTDAPARRAMDAALQLLAGTDALIIDLRDNGGGSPAMVGYLASAFTAPGAPIFNTFQRRDGSGSEAPLRSHPSPRLHVPLFVLVSARTGSAAESFAYTLKNAGRARIVGEPSAGAANPGGAVDAGNGFRVFVSTGSPVSPITGRNWEGEGVLPDVPSSPEEAPALAQELALEAVLAAGITGIGAVQARWALETLHAERAPSVPVPLADYAASYGSLQVLVQDGQLSLRNGRRPALSLLPLGQDRFAVRGHASMRVRFVRDTSGRVIAVETLNPDGNLGRFPRETSATGS